MVGEIFDEQRDLPQGTIIYQLIATNSRERAQRPLGRLVADEILPEGTIIATRVTHMSQPTHGNQIPAWLLDTFILDEL